MRVYKNIKAYSNSDNLCPETYRIIEIINEHLSQYYDAVPMTLWVCRAESALIRQGYMSHYAYGWIGYYNHKTHCYAKIWHEENQLMIAIEEEPVIL